MTVLKLAEAARNSTLSLLIIDVEEERIDGRFWPLGVGKWVRCGRRCELRGLVERVEHPGGSTSWRDVVKAGKGKAEWAGGVGEGGDE